jgi:hypothetical protein
MTTDGEQARRALIEALREDAREDVPNDEFERACDRVLVRLWMAGFVVTAREPTESDDALRPTDQHSD